MPAGHLISWLDLALYCDKDLDHFHDARQQVIAALQLIDLIFETSLELINGVVELLFDSFNFVIDLVILDNNLLPLTGRELGQEVLGYTTSDLCALRSAGHRVIQ